MIDIRDECPGDWKAVYQVISAAFGQSAEAELVERLREAGDSVISLVAEEDSQVVAHVLLSKMDARSRHWRSRPYRSFPQGSGAVLDQL